MSVVICNNFEVNWNNNKNSVEMIVYGSNFTSEKPNKGYSNSLLPSVICNLYRKHKLLSVCCVIMGKLLVANLEHEVLLNMCSILQLAYKFWNLQTC